MNSELSHITNVYFLGVFKYLMLTIKQTEKEYIKQRIRQERLSLIFWATSSALSLILLKILPKLGFFYFFRTFLIYMLIIFLIPFLTLSLFQEFPSLLHRQKELTKSKGIVRGIFVKIYYYVSGFITILICVLMFLGLLYGIISSIVDLIQRFNK